MARATEAFDNCERRANVKFPEEARGWILLHRAQLTEDQQAVVLARAGGSLKRDDIAVSLRSCFPDLILRSQKNHPAHLVDEPSFERAQEEEDDDPEMSEFQDVEALLSEHVTDLSPSAAESFTEVEAAEVLATTWKEKRQELSKLQKSRRVTAAKESKRSLRIEVEVPQMWPVRPLEQRAQVQDRSALWQVQGQRSQWIQLQCWDCWRGLCAGCRGVQVVAGQLSALQHCPLFNNFR